ncbi:hypothetical protein [Streptomyces sp. DW26H14]|uniref:hypothetical protein n=1 Tax=Streptomyces sp. DW26H14 TaxID=3435395 RepID=UPI00403D7CF4
MRPLEIPRDAAEALYEALGAVLGEPHRELTAAAEEIARLEEELVAARSAVDRVHGLAEYWLTRSDGRMYGEEINQAISDTAPPVADETPVEAARADRAYWERRFERGGER